MTDLPNGATELPEDYLAYLRSIEGNQVLGKAILFSEAKDPGVCLGRLGSENFMWSLIIGRMGDVQIFMRYGPRKRYEKKMWQYCLSEFSDWDLLAAFPTLGELLAYLRSPSE